MSGETFRHRKGGLYEVVTTGLLESDLTPVTVYRDMERETVWVRPTSEFTDGRFQSELVPDERPREPRVVTICGSSSFVEIMAVCAWVLERDEGVLTMGLHLLPQWYGMGPDHGAEEEGVADRMDELHLRKINLADEVFVVDHHNYVGSSTQRELRHAEALGRPVRMFSTDPVGDYVRRILKGTRFGDGSTVKTGDRV